MDRRTAVRGAKASVLQTLGRAWIAAGLLLLAGACRQDMFDQPKVKPLAESDFFRDGQAVRPQVPDTVARGQFESNRPFATGIGEDGQFLTTLPVPLTRARLERGRERFNIFCSPCHDRVGRGAGMIVQRGFKPPPSYHIDRLRMQPIGYFFDVMTHGFGEMPGYASQVPAADRWAIAAYIQALQLSQHAPLGGIPEGDRRAIEALPPPAPGPGASQAPEGAIASPERAATPAPEGNSTLEAVPGPAPAPKPEGNPE